MSRGGLRWVRRAMLLLAVGLAACNQAPPSWGTLLTAKIREQYPAYQVTPQPDDQLRVERPGLAPVTVAVAPIAQLCQRGPRECDYAVDQLLLTLRAPAP